MYRWPLLQYGGDWASRESREDGRVGQREADEVREAEIFTECFHDRIYAAQLCKRGHLRERDRNHVRPRRGPFPVVCKCGLSLSRKVSLDVGYSRQDGELRVVSSVGIPKSSWGPFNACDTPVGDQNEERAKLLGHLPREFRHRCRQGSIG